MKKIDFIVPEGHYFNIGNETFLIEEHTLNEITRIGLITNKLMSAMQAVICTVMNDNLRLTNSHYEIRKILLSGIHQDHKKILDKHPKRNSLMTRIDFMIDTNDELRIAEIDPTNKHGLGFALLCRYETGHGENQKMLTLFSELIEPYNELVILIAKNDKFFQKDQEYFAKQLNAYTKKPVSILTEENSVEINEKVKNPLCCFLDCPVFERTEVNKSLVDLFVEFPKRFLVPPKHWMGNKAIMSFVYEPAFLKIISSFLSDEDILLLQKYIPKTYTINPLSNKFIVKKVLSSGAKGVFFNGNAPTKDVIYQEFIKQKKFILEGNEQHVRLAAHFVGVKLAELTVTSSKNLPVHGGSESINFHVGLKSK
jgi:hypothetical protein